MFGDKKGETPTGRNIHARYGQAPSNQTPSPSGLSLGLTNEPDQYMLGIASRVCTYLKKMFYNS